MSLSSAWADAEDDEALILMATQAEKEFKNHDHGLIPSVAELQKELSNLKTKLNFADLEKRNLLERNRQLEDILKSSANNDDVTFTTPKRAIARQGQKRTFPFTFGNFQGTPSDGVKKAKINDQPQSSSSVDLVTEPCPDDRVPTSMLVGERTAKLIEDDGYSDDYKLLFDGVQLSISKTDSPNNSAVSEQHCEKRCSALFSISR